ncbi:hypothetical protein ACPPVV_01025 [Rhodanobacter sp. Col0626]|uniref:hypothetical protein n=1 Tax=Rhodanobacter sp. Col0626 TaxID=3415679 RepID=UPI003CF75FC5
MQTFVEILHDARVLGVDTLPDGTELLGRLPHVGESAYLHVLFSALTASDLDELEIKLSRRVPEVIAEFLLNHNGLIAYQGALSVAGRRSNFSRDSSNRQPFDILEGNTYSRVSEADADDFFFGSYNWDGSLLFVRGDSPFIYRRSRSSAAVLNSWPSMTQMLDLEICRISKLFDKLGQETDQSVPTTPGNDLITPPS